MYVHTSMYAHTSMYVLIMLTGGLRHRINTLSRPKKPPTGVRLVLPVWVIPQKLGSQTFTPISAYSQPGVSQASKLCVCVCVCVCACIKNRMV